MKTTDCSMTRLRLIVVLCCLLHPSSFIPHPSDAARADDVIDSPMYRDPDFAVPRMVKTFPENLPALWLRALERPEADIRCRAALTIAQAREVRMTGLEVTIPALVRELGRADQHPTVRLAAARALVALDAKSVAPELLKACRAGDTDLRELLEPVLAKWEYGPASDEWLGRIGQGPPKWGDSILAIRGLAALREVKAVPRLRELVFARETPPAVRLEAARALGVIRTSGSEADADALAGDASARGIVGRQAAASLLRHHGGDEAIRRLQKLGGDPEPSVAAIALARLMEIDTRLVVPLLPAVLTSTDAPVRAFGVETLLRNPTDDHVRLLGDRLSDPHPDVRARAREALRELAGKPEFAAPVLREADRALPGRDWRGREQAAILFGQLDHKPAAGKLVEKLRDERAECAVAAAWALRKLAVPESGPGVLEYVRNYIRRGDNAARRKLPSEALDSQLSQLFQMLGLVRYRPAEGAMLGLLPEGSPAGNETRAAASWALGLLHEGQPVPQVVAALTDRVAAVMPFHVEDSRVRRMCAVSLGRMKAKEAVPTLESFYRWMPTIDPVNNACGWAIEQITGERVPAPVDVPLLQRGWFLTTLD